MIRYLFAFISFLLKNLWMAVLWTIEMCAFRFDHFRLFIWETVRSILKVVRIIPALRNPG